MMWSYFDEDFFKMTGGFATILVFALVAFYLLNYFSQDEKLGEIVSSIFSALMK
ncbi:MAG: hypothetical protein NTY66_04245 [Candidatus Vogelbacteria bacterium]|nr:hypothetical protein [Candidatus Vogelbacteria bacterium]